MQKTGDHEKTIDLLVSTNYAVIPIVIVLEVFWVNRLITVYYIYS